MAFEGWRSREEEGESEVEGSGEADQLEGQAEEQAE